VLPWREEVEQLIQGAIAMHLKGMRKDGAPIPEPNHHGRRIRGCLTNAPCQPNRIASPAARTATCAT